MSRDRTQTAWRAAIDWWGSSSWCGRVLKLSHRTLAPLSFASHVIALGSIFTGALLSLERTVLSDSGPSDASVADSSPDRLAIMLSHAGAWEEEYSASVEQIDGELPGLCP